MTIREVFSAIFGWCPRYDEKMTRSIPAPIVDLSTIGKIVISILLASWGLFSILIYYGNPVVSEAIAYGVFQPQTVLYIILTILSATSGVMLLTLLADFVISQMILRRHKLELFIVLSSQALIWLVAPFEFVIMYLVGNKINGIESIIINQFSLCIPEALLFSYLAYRVLSDKPILGGKSFLFLFFVFLVPFTRTVDPSYIFTAQQSLLEMVNRGMFTLVYGVAALFCINVYVKSRGKTEFEMSLPLYARVIVFIYGLVHSGIFSFLATGEARYFLFVSGNAPILAYWPYFVYFLGLMAASFLPLRFRVGEKPLITQELRT